MIQASVGGMETRFEKINAERVEMQELVNITKVELSENPMRRRADIAARIEAIFATHEGTGAPTISAYVKLTLDNAEGRMPGKSSVTIRRTIGLEKDEYSIDKKTATKGSFLVCWKQSALARAISPENLEDVKEKSDLLIKICEAIVEGKQEGAEFDEEEVDIIYDRTIEFSLPLQLAALACLIDLYAGRNCDGSSKTQDVLHLDVSNDIPKRVSAILTRFVDIVGFPAIDSKHEVGPERMQLLQFKILDVFMGVYTLMSIGLLRPDVAILWYACYGGATEQFGGNSVKLLGGT
jgi:hypothetical protein